MMNKNMPLEVLSQSQNRKEQVFFLQEKLTSCGLDESALVDYKNLISKIDFKNIDLSSEAAIIHINMLAALLTKQENNEIFFQNILNEISKDLELVDNIVVASAKEVEAENIDLDIGSNRRVDWFRCFFTDGDIYEFTLSADLEKHQDDADSNSFVEKKIFSDPIGIDNPWLQRYFSYIKKENRGTNQRFIAKEYLPGKNIVQYFNELDSGKLGAADFIDVACETAYTIGALYKRMDGQLLNDLKLENIIYNYEDPDGAKPACRICDHSGYYSDEVDRRSASQILSHLQSFMTLYYSKAIRSKSEDLRQDVVEIISAYLDAFSLEVDEKLIDKFLDNVGRLRDLPASKRQWELSDDLLDYVLNYEFKSE